MKKKLLSAIAVMLLLLLCLTGCGKYSSSYRAVGFVHSNDSRSAFMNFHSFEGTMVFTLKYSGSSGTQIKYSAKLEDGSAKVYYDNGGEKTELFSVKSGDDISSAGGDLSEGTVYIIVETGGTCKNGEIRFEIG